MNIPKKRDLNIYDSLDEIDLEKRWLGASLPEAVQLLEKYNIDAIGDFLFMGLTGLLYYLHAVRKYVADGMATEDHVFVGAVLRLFLFRTNEMFDSGRDYSVVKDTLLAIEKEFDAIYSDEFSDPKRYKFILKNLLQVYTDKDMSEEVREALIDKLEDISKGRSLGLGKKMEWELE